MPGSGSGGGMMPVERAELVTRDMEMITALISRMYAEHRARSRRIPGATPETVIEGAVAGVLRAGVTHMAGVEYAADAADTGGHPMGLVAFTGSGELTAGKEQRRFAGGEVIMAPADQPYAAWIRGLSAAWLQIPWSVAAQLAETHTGLPVAGLRFASMGPVSKAAGAAWARTVAFGCQQLISSRATEISPLIAQEMTRLTAAAMLETFPNTAMTLDYARGPGWVPPAAVRRAAAFIEENPERPITLDDMAAAAGITGRALQYAFRRHYDTTPTGYLRQIRLEHAHHELATAGPGAGTTVAAIARKWGWANAAHFAAAYRQHYGQPPGQTLRT